MSKNNHKEWAPGLVALYRANGLGSGTLDFAIRTAGNARQWVAKDGRWHSEGSDDWGAFAWYWPEEPVWVGSRETYREMRAAATDPADLWRIVCGTVEIPETAPNRADSTVVIFGEEYVKVSDSREALAQAEATIETLRRDLRDAEENSNTWCDRFDYLREQMDRIREALGGRFAGESTSGMVAEIERLREEIKTHRHAAADAQMRRDASVQCYAAEANSARVEVRNLRSEIDRLRARMDDIPGLLEGVLGFRPYEITAEGLGGSPSSLPKGRGLVAYDIETKYPEGRGITRVTLGCQK